MAPYEGKLLILDESSKLGGSEFPIPTFPLRANGLFSEHERSDREI